jgi:hypothetical protein
VDLVVRTTDYTQGNQKWLGSAHGTNTCDTITLDLSLFTGGTHYPNGFIPSGMALGKVTATGVYGPYNDALATGVQTLVGHLYTDVKVATDNVAGKAVGALLRHGQVITANLPTNHGVDAAGIVDVKGAIIYV